jgi:hypothetical protein
LDQLALGLVVAVHRGDTDGAAALLRDLLWDDLLGICVILASTLDVAWSEQCDVDGIGFDGLVRETGLWLAEMERP